VIGAVMALVLLGPVNSDALSLRSSAAEVFLGDVSPGTEAVASKAAGQKLRVENSGREMARVEFKAVAVSPDGLKDGYDPWPFVDQVRVDKKIASTLAPSAAVETDLRFMTPKDEGLVGGQYQFDVLALGSDRNGASLTLKTRVLLSIANPLSGGASSGSEPMVDRPGFTLSPPWTRPEKVPWARQDRTEPKEATTLKLINASDEDLTVTFTPTRDWDDEAKVIDGFAPAPNPHWLRVESKVITLRAGQIGRARIWTQIPRQARYGGRRWAFVMKVEAIGADRLRRRRWEAILRHYLVEGP
jgi:hypothetical protein